VHLHVTEVRPVHRRRRDQLLFIKCAQFVVGVVVLNGSGSGRAVRQRVRRRRRLGVPRPARRRDPVDGFTGEPTDRLRPIFLRRREAAVRWNPQLLYRSATHCPRRFVFDVVNCPITTRDKFRPRLTGTDVDRKSK